MGKSEVALLGASPKFCDWASRWCRWAAVRWNTGIPVNAMRDTLARAGNCHNQHCEVAFLIWVLALRGDLLLQNQTVQRCHMLPSHVSLPRLSMHWKSPTHRQQTWIRGVSWPKASLNAHQSHWGLRTRENSLGAMQKTMGMSNQEHTAKIRCECSERAYVVLQAYSLWTPVPLFHWPTPKLSFFFSRSLHAQGNRWNQKERGNVF